MIRNKFEVAQQLKEKWRKDAESKGLPFVVFMMVCVVCGQSKERTLEYYRVNCGYDQLFTRECGKELFSNCISTPCIACSSKINKEKRQTKNGFILKCISTARSNHIKYIKQEKIPDDLFQVSAETVDCLLQEKHERCVKTGVRLTFGCHKDFAMSIDRINNSKGYLKNNIQLVCREVNVSGKDTTCGQTNCDDYVRVFKSIIDYICYLKVSNVDRNIFELNFKQTPTQNGVSVPYIENRNLHEKQCRDLHLRSILQIMCMNANIDKQRGREGGKLTVEMLMNILRRHGFRCFYSKTPLEISIYSKYRFSFERLDNSKGHGVSGNCVPVVRFLNCTDNSARKDSFGTFENNGAGMSTKKLIRIILLTNIIKISPYERACLEGALTLCGFSLIKRLDNIIKVLDKFIE